MYRTENDLIGDLQVPIDAYYGVQTQRAINNFNITGIKLSHYPELVKALAYVKWAAAKTNFELKILDENIYQAIVKACQEVIKGKYDKEFPSDVMQGGAGTSANMNINEVLANIALEIMKHKKGEYQYCSPHDHVNLSQSTNDAYPTALKLSIITSNEGLVKNLNSLIESFKVKSKEFSNVLKMGRTQLQDAVPMTLGQEFEAFADMLAHEKECLSENNDLFEINMGATAIGTGLNAIPGYAELCANNLAEISKYPFKKAKNLVEATPDTGPYVNYSSKLRKLAIKLSKICNDLRLLSSGPRCGLHEITLPAMQPGSSIMPGKVNPVIPEVVNQTCFKIIGNDLTVTMAAEAGQLQLNVMEPVIIYSILESINILTNALNCLNTNCIEGITANEKHSKNMVLNSIGIVTALNPYIGYKNSTKIAKEALENNLSVYDLVLKNNLLSQEKLDEILNPENMLRPHEYSK